MQMQVPLSPENTGSIQVLVLERVVVDCPAETGMSIVSEDIFFVIFLKLPSSAPQHFKMKRLREAIMALSDLSEDISTITPDFESSLNFISLYEMFCNVIWFCFKEI